MHSEVEVHEFITCLRELTLDQIIMSNNKVTLISKVIVSTKSLIKYAKVLFTHYVQLNQR